MTLLIHCMMLATFFILSSSYLTNNGAFLCLKIAEDPGVFDHVIVNDDLQRAYQRLRATVTQVRSSFCWLRIK